MAGRKARENEIWNVKAVASENCRYTTAKLCQSTLQVVGQSLRCRQVIESIGVMSKISRGIFSHVAALVTYNVIGSLP